MKKFTLLAIGESFEFQGEQYLKNGPLTARSLSGNQQRMIPRSAIVMPLDATPAPPQEPEANQCLLPEAQVLEAFEHYHKGCMEWLLLTEELDTEVAARIREAMQTARERFLSEIKQLSVTE